MARFLSQAEYMKKYAEYWIDEETEDTDEPQSDSNAH